MMRTLIIITALIFLTGCLRPNYVPQYVEVPNNWRLETDEASTLCNFRWWEQFNDPVLNDLILLGLWNNQDLKIAISRVVEFYERLGVTSAALYPEIDGRASYTRNESSLLGPIGSSTTGLPASVTTRYFNDFVAFFALSWELDFWGRIHSATEAAWADLLSQVEARRAVVITVATSIAKAYIELRNLDGQLEVSIKTRKSREESLKLAVDRFRLGETSELEVKQAEAELEIAIIRQLQTERAIPQQENLLSILIGENPHAILRGQSLNALHYPVSIPAGLPSDLLVRRPDIVQAEDEMISANAHVAEARALFFPKIILTGLFGNESKMLHNLLTLPAQFWLYGASATQTIFDAGKTMSQVDEAKAIRDELLFNYRQTILNAFREVDDALIACKMNKELVAEHEKQVKILHDYLHLAQLRYEEGEVDYLNVLDAERSLFDAELALVQAQADNFTSVIQLYGALGGGWVADADATALHLQCE